MARNHVEGGRAVCPNVAFATALVAALFQSADELGCERGKGRGLGSRGARVLCEESGEGLAGLLGSKDASIVGKGVEEDVEGLHGVEVGGYDEGCTVFEVDEPIKGVSFFEIFQVHELSLKCFFIASL
jgi:hypothetical protein